MKQPNDRQRDSFITGVKDTIRQHMHDLNLPVDNETCQALTNGKMVRSKLGARIACGQPEESIKIQLQTSCAAVEMVHTAALCHDDVIDSSNLRRGQTSLWQKMGTSPAILTGDILLCESIGMIAKTGNDMLQQRFLSAIQEICHTEIKQEIRLRGKSLDKDTVHRIARGKTGPLFAFVGFAATFRDPAQRRILEETGYKIGTVYQLADDLIDIAGNEDSAGKTLGTDEKRGKATIAHNKTSLINIIHRLCDEACEGLSGWPTLARCIESFLSHDMQPAIQKQCPDLHLELISH